MEGEHLKEFGLCNASALKGLFVTDCAGSWSKLRFTNPLGVSFVCFVAVAVRSTFSAFFSPVYQGRPALWRQFSENR